MTFAKKHHDYYSQFDEDVNPITEKAVCYALCEKGLKYGKDFSAHEKIDNVAFNKRGKHDVDLVLTSRNGDKLYVEVKGQMTFLEVNKLKYLLGLDYNFYILQLTELDWITPYVKAEHKSEFKKSKSDFELQIGELVKFVKGELTGEELSKESLKRLNDFVDCRSHDLENWNANSDR